MRSTAGTGARSVAQVLDRWPVHQGLALLLSLAAVFGTLWVGSQVFENLPHLEDEFAYVWQAEAMAGGRLTLPTPEQARHFLVPFVVDFNGQRFGKYPLGWPALLGLGVRLDLRDWINPLLAGLSVWFTFRLGEKVFSRPVGLLAALLTATSPFFLVNGGSLLSHPLGLFLSLSFALGWIEAFSGSDDPRLERLGLVAGALALGVLAITRPLTAVAMALPFGVHALVLLVRERGAVVKRLLSFAILAGSVASLQFLWQWAATGDPFLNLYTLWWPYDKVGFGPGVGRYGHNLRLAQINTQFSLWVGARDLFGWGPLSGMFLPFGIWAARRNGRAWLIGSLAPVLIVVYLAYWVGSWLFGPRYYFEALFSVTLLSAAGIAWLAGWRLAPRATASEPSAVESARSGWARLRPITVLIVVAALVSANLAFYSPLRLQSMQGLYGIRRERLAPFQSAETQGLTPALVIVHPQHWTEYGNLLPLQDAYLNSPFLVTISRGPEADAALAAAYPKRSVFHYFPDRPYIFFKTVR